MRPSGIAKCLALTVSMVHGILLFFIAARTSPNPDELAHLPSGIHHWQSGSFDLYRVNPPLIRLWAALPVVLCEPKTNYRWCSTRPYARPEFAVAQDFLQLNGESTFHYFRLARWSCIPWMIIGGWVCYVWAAELYGPWAGVTAIVLWTSCPNLLAWGATIMPDAPASALAIVAGFAYWRWWQQPVLRRAICAGVTLALAILTKATLVVFVPLWLGTAALRVLLQTRTVTTGRVESARAIACQSFAICLIAVYCVNLGYAFEGTLKPLGQFTFISEALGGPGAHAMPQNRFRETCLHSITVALPENLIRGIDVQKYDFERKMWSYLRGENRFGGWWYYYIYAALVKVPTGTIALSLIALGMTFARRCLDFKCRSHAFFLLAPAAAIMLLVSSQTGFNHHFRYVLPCLPFWYIWISKVSIVFRQKSLICKRAVVAIAIWSILNGIMIFPSNLSYFNEFAGGPYNGWRHLAGSNIEWGQDLFDLKNWYDSHPQARPFYVVYSGAINPNFVGVGSVPVPRVLKPGWYAIGVNQLAGSRTDTDDRNYAFFQRHVAAATIGYSFRVYQLRE